MKSVTGAMGLSAWLLHVLCGGCDGVGDGNILDSVKDAVLMLSI